MTSGKKQASSAAALIALVAAVAAWYASERRPLDQPSSPTIVTAAIPYTQVGNPYAVAIVASGGRPPYSWSIISGSLPPPFQLVANVDGSATIKGTPVAPASATFTIQVADQRQKTAQRSYALAIYPHIAAIEAQINLEQARSEHAAAERLYRVK